MHKFWYHSVVRFFRNTEDLIDLENPQNAQYFGHKNPYPLEIGKYHRFPIPNVDNDIDDDKLKLWLINDRETQIPAKFKVIDGKLISITFISYDEIAGHLEIRKESGETIYFSNCVNFMDSTDFNGRKYIRIATRSTYNKNLFTWEDEKHDWLVTNLPAYNMGTFDIDEDVKSSRLGGGGSTVNTSPWIEERVSYRFEIKGDDNIIAFITVHSLNQDLYIEGTKRTRREKPEIGDMSSDLVMKFSNIKDENGMNITINEREIFGDVFNFALGNNEKTKIYTYDNNTKAIKTK